MMSAVPPSPVASAHEADPLAAAADVAGAASGVVPDAVSPVVAVLSSDVPQADKANAAMMGRTMDRFVGMLSPYSVDCTI
jgi:hypothetical protein